MFEYDFSPIVGELGWELEIALKRTPCDPHLC
jgi:hypothetical protein